MTTKNDDLISRAAAIEYLITNMGWHDEDGYTVDDDDEKRAIITDLVNGIPAVDAAPVVRCRDCVYGCLSKNARGEYRVFCENPDFEGMDYLVNEPDWYCADGERRDSE